MNNFTFDGFPQIKARYENDDFLIQLKIDEHVSSEVSVQFDFVKRAMDKYDEDGDFEKPLFKVMQKLVVELESLCRSGKTR